MASNRDWGVAPAFQTIPPFAGPNDPAIGLGTEPIPPELVSYYAPDVVKGVIIARYDEDIYEYQALVIENPDIPYWAVGSVGFNISDNQYVSESFRVAGQRGGLGTSALLIGGKATSLGAAPQLFIRGAIFHDAGTFRHEAPVLVTGPFGSLTIDASRPFVIDGVSAPRSLVAWAASQANTPAVGTVFQHAMDTPTATFRAGRAFDLEIGGTALASLSTNVIEFAINIVYTVGGEQSLWHTTSFGPSGANPAIDTHSGTVIVNTSGVDKQGFLRVYIRAQNAGTVTWLGSAFRPRWIRARDCGAATDYPGALVMP